MYGLALFVKEGEGYDVVMGGGGGWKRRRGLAEDCLDVRFGACLPLRYVLDTRYSRRWDERQDLKVAYSIN